MNLISKTKSILQYASDLHLERGLKRHITPTKPFLLLGGDIGYPRQESYKNFLFKVSSDFDKVFILSGNHEFDLSINPYNINPTEEIIINICNMRNNLYYLQKNEHIIDESENIVLAGCTLFSELPKSKNSYHNDHSTWLDNITKNSNKNYVIATHHCPHIKLLAKKYINFIPRYFASDQSNIFMRNNVFMWIYGHSHFNFDYTMQNTFFTCNQYGYK